MTTGDIACAEKLLQPARMVLKMGLQVRHEPYERRVGLWNDIRTNQDRFLREECGTFLPEVDLDMRARSDAALALLAVAFGINHEDFSATAVFPEAELDLVRRIEQYNRMEILTQDEIRNRIMKRDADLIGLLKEYYLTMDRYVETTLDDPGIRLTLRYFLKRRWNVYRGKMDNAIADAVTHYGWMQEMVKAWQQEKEKA